MRHARQLRAARTWLLLLVALVVPAVGAVETLSGAVAAVGKAVSPEGVRAGTSAAAGVVAAVGAARVLAEVLPTAAALAVAAAKGGHKQTTEQRGARAPAQTRTLPPF